MKYCVLIIDGAAGDPIPEKGGKTSLELARTPNLDILSSSGTIGLARTVPVGMEPSSALACLSILGYDPKVYYKGRSAIEAVSMGISIERDETAFRCNLVAVKEGIMLDYSAGHITTNEAAKLIDALEKELGNDNIHFFPGVSYRHLLKIRGHEEAVEAECTPPHDISGKAIKEFLPKGEGSAIINDLMQRSEAILANHPVNKARQARGEIPATTVWLFWPSGQVPALPSFNQKFGLKAAMISGVDLLRGLAKMSGMEIVKVAGVTDGMDNDYKAQGKGAIEVLKQYDLVVVHVEAPDEAGHSGSLEEKIKAIEETDREITALLRNIKDLRILVMPDHPTPVKLRTHTPEPVPFLLSGPGFTGNGARRLTEAEAKVSGFFIDSGYDIISKLIN